MKISINWIKDYIDLEGLDLTLVADRVTNCGVSVEGVETQKEIKI